jgi:hypothetical protein
MYGCDVLATAEAIDPISRIFRAAAINRRRAGMERFAGAVPGAGFVLGVSAFCISIDMDNSYSIVQSRSWEYSEAMTRAISIDRFLATAPETLSSVGDDAFVIRQGEKFVAAIVGEKDFEAIRAARGKRAIAAMNRLSDALEASGASQQELLDLEKALDRKA